MDGKNCQSCLEYRAGECLGRELCEFYREAPTDSKKAYATSQTSGRGSYAGSGTSGFMNIYDPRSNSYKNASIKSNNNRVRRSDNRAKLVDFKIETIDSAMNIDELSYSFRGKLLAWVEFEIIENAAGIEYKANCLLQLDDYVLLVDEAAPEKREERAMLQSICKAAEHIRKPFEINIITDRDLFKGIKLLHSEQDVDLLNRAVKSFANKGCTIKELVINKGIDLIRKQVNQPVLSFK